MTMKYDRKSLFGYPTFNEHGVQILTETNGLYANMLMNISSPAYGGANAFFTGLGARDCGAAP